MEERQKNYSEGLTPREIIRTKYDYSGHRQDTSRIDELEEESIHLYYRSDSLLVRHKPRLQLGLIALSQMHRRTAKYLSDRDEIRLRRTRNHVNQNLDRYIEQAKQEAGQEGYLIQLN